MSPSVVLIQTSPLSLSIIIHKPQNGTGGLISRQQKRLLKAPSHLLLVEVVIKLYKWLGSVMTTLFTQRLQSGRIIRNEGS
jgi:hypothetical protein